MPVGEAATRAAAAEALLIAADSMAGASDSETLRQLVVSMDGVLAGELLFQPLNEFVNLPAAAGAVNGWSVGG